VQEEPVLPPDLIAMARWMQTYYAAPLEGILGRWAAA
jgi:primosomal protein N'